MTRGEAAVALIREVRKEKGSKAALVRLRSACMVLCLTDEETRLIEKLLEYRDDVTGELYPVYC